MSITHQNFAYIYGKFVLERDACLHVGDLSIQRGYGVFDFFRVHAGRPLFREEALERFYLSAAYMDLTVPLDIEALGVVLDEFIFKNQTSHAGIKLILTGGESTNGYDLAAPNLIVVQNDIAQPTHEQFEKGMKVVTQEYIREFPRAKTINYSMGIRLLKTIKERGKDDVLYRRNGTVTEFPRSSFFIVRQDDTIVTAEEGVLLGITRKHVIELARQKYRTETSVITLNDIAQAKEAFMTSTTKRILPVVEVDDQMIGNGEPGQITRELLKGLIELEEQRLSISSTH